MEANDTVESKTHVAEKPPPVINIDAENSNASPAHEANSKESKDEKASVSNVIEAEEAADIIKENALQIEVDLVEQYAKDDDENVKKWPSPDAINNESPLERDLDDEPMDIDEILDSLNTDQDAMITGEEFCGVQSGVVDERAAPQENVAATEDNDENENVEEKISDLPPDAEIAENKPNEELPIQEAERSASILNELKDNASGENSENPFEVLEGNMNFQSDENNDDVIFDEKNAQPSPANNGIEIDLVAVTKDLEEENIRNGFNESDAVPKSGETEIDSGQSRVIQEGQSGGAVADESVSVFDLLMENEELFGKVDENIGETLDEAQNKDVDVEMGDQPNVLAISVSSEVTEIEVQSSEDNVNEENGQLKDMALLHKECLNVECEKKSNIFYGAPEFVINHFHMNKRQKIQYVCENCYELVIQSYKELSAALLDNTPLFSKKIKYTDLVEIIDSSDEEDGDETTNPENGQTLFDADTLSLIENELENVIKETFEKVNIKQQMTWNRQILKTKIDDNEKNCTEMMKEMNTLQKRVDKLYTETYNFKHTFVEEVQSLDLQTLKPTQICNQSYPPAGEIKHPEIQFNTLYYTFRTKVISRWLPCKVTNKTETQSQTEYTVKFCREKKTTNNTKTVWRKHLAYGRSPDYRLNIGTRVIALFDSTDNSSNVKPLRSNFYPGVVAEPLSLYSNWRYLVFFDDGWVEYVQHENVRVLCEDTENVWELIEEPGAKTYIEGYLREFKKKRPIVQLKCGQRIQTELGGKWYNGIVNAVDGSLVQIFFEENRRYEWIYRGSTRLFPLYRKLKQATPSANRSEAIIEYIVIDDDKEPERSIEPPAEELPQPETPPQKTAPIQRTFASQAARDTPQQKQREQKRAVAKKSTAPLPKPAIQHMNNSTIYVDEDKPKGKVVYYTAKKHIDVKKYIHHDCQSSCLVHVQHNLSSYSPLSKPLLSGFERQICKTRFNKKYVVYRGPCGRRLRDMYEMHKYLRMTNCKLNVENFTFDPLIHCLAEYVIDSYVMKKPDLSEGVEKIPVQLINCYDNTLPPPCTYSAKRISTEGVNLNCDEEFLCGCDCTDDCIDKSKCACWQLTLQGAKYGNPDIPIEDVGYEYKRLNDPVPTGIYECNSRCKCKSNCLNRVVQHPLQLKLQVFKTVNRGWGLRCLNDVARGSFICCYAGNLLTETAANEAGGDLGDEYFAELDYIEVVENMKEGYEPEVIHDDDSSGTDEDFDVEKESMHTRNDDSDDEFVAKSYTASEDSESRRYRTRNSVDTRKKEFAPTAVPAKHVEKRKEKSISSDEEGDDVRQVKNFMASNTMPLSDEPDDDKSKFGIRKFFGKDEAVLIMDAKKAGNIGRYFNHSCGPNLFVQNVFVDTHDLRFPWVAFFASTHIRAGTELTWNYNYEVGSVPGKVLICQCGDEKCRGRIL